MYTNKHDQQNCTEKKKNQSIDSSKIVNTVAILHFMLLYAPAGNGIVKNSLAAIWLQQPVQEFLYSFHLELYSFQLLLDARRFVSQEVTKRCRRFGLTNSALAYER